MLSQHVLDLGQRLLAEVGRFQQLDLGALHQVANVQNAFITTPNKEKIWICAGPKLGHEQGKVFLVVQALYGLKSASASFRAFLAEKLDSRNFNSSRADPDVWMRPVEKM